jgi:diketogulonate reductase-like aldo/keto reductase
LRSPIGGSKTYNIAATNPLEDKVVTDLIAKYGKTPDQVVIRWHLDYAFFAIPKSVKPHRIAENLGVFDFTFSVDEVLGDRRARHRRARWFRPGLAQPERPWLGDRRLKAAWRIVCGSPRPSAPFITKELS